MLLAQQQQQRRNQRAAGGSTGSTGGSSVPSSRANVWWCCTVLAALKWLEVLFAVIIVAVVAPVLCLSPGQYDFVMFAAAFCLCVTALTMIIYFLRLHVGPLKAMPWRKMEMAFNILAVILYLAAVGIGIYHCVKLFAEEYHEMSVNHGCAFRLSPTDVQFNEEWRGRIAAATAFCVLNAILHVLSIVYARDVHVFT